MGCSSSFPADTFSPTVTHWTSSGAVISQTPSQFTVKFELAPSGETVTSWLSTWRFTTRKAASFSFSGSFGQQENARKARATNVTGANFIKMNAYTLGKFKKIHPKLLFLCNKSKMSMFSMILLFLAGLALVVFGADWLVEGSSGVARRAGLSEFVIGLTIVGMGTSAPEMVVSFIGALEGNGDIAVGNVVGSNIFNTLLILGLTALILPMGITRGNRRRDIPVNFIVTLLLILLGLKFTLFGLGTDGLTRMDGIILLILFAAYMWYSFKRGKADPQEESHQTGRNIWICIMMIAAGIAGLILGGKMFVNNAVAIAKELGVSDKFIAITVLAGGTSLPELATCVAAAVKKRGQLALGNIIGSNLFNILLILGGSAVIAPLSFKGINLVDMGALMASAIALVTCLFIGKKNVLDRLDGALFLLLWAGYMTNLVINL